MIVAICDALGFIGDARAIPHLKHVMDLRHRRLQVEAAAALVRLGDEDGIQRLAERASDTPMRHTHWSPGHWQNSSNRLAR